MILFKSTGVGVVGMGNQLSETWERTHHPWGWWGRWGLGVCLARLSIHVCLPGVGVGVGVCLFLPTRPPWVWAGGGGDHLSGVKGEHHHHLFNHCHHCLLSYPIITITRWGNWLGKGVGWFGVGVFTRLSGGKNLWGVCGGGGPGVWELWEGLAGGGKLSVHPPTLFHPPGAWLAHSITTTTTWLNSPGSPPTQHHPRLSPVGLPTGLAGPGGIISPPVITNHKQE